MHVYERSPYTGQLVFAAFSGSHQDAIAKGMKWKEDHNLEHWSVPYLPLDPQDVGRKYDGDVIRINSQSGKGGIGYLLEQKYGFDLPPKMREDLGYTVKDVSDHMHKELAANEVLDIFQNTYVNVHNPIELLEAHFTQGEQFTAEITINVHDARKVYHGAGNGRLDAISNAVKRHFNIEFSLICYEEHALQVGSNSQACAYVGIQKEDGSVAWGAGIQNDIIEASAFALMSAINRSGLVK